MLKQSHQSLAHDRSSIERKIDNVTDGLPKQVSRKLRSVTNERNVIEIANYVMAMKTEVNISDNYRAGVIKTLCLLSTYHNHTNFRQLTRDNLIAYLDSRRKSESEDPQHRWIGTYNLYRSFLLRFFKWLYYPDFTPSERPKPPCVENMPQLKRKEVSIYFPADLWTAEDDILFLRYCPSKRDRCYHTISRDTSCRPHEILKLKIKDINFKMVGNKQYAEVILTGKTGQRHVPIINSLPYLKDWMDDHPIAGNPNSPLICGFGRSLGRRVSPNSINRIYHDYQKRFRSLIDDPNVPQTDKVAITKLLKKPWNPYVRRHSALTEKSKFLKESILRQHAGWSKNSEMPNVYLHYFGNESSESILEAYGLKPKIEQMDRMKPKHCSNCGEANMIDSRFCSKCRMVLSYDAYTETVEENAKQTDELTKMKERQEKFELILQSLIDSGQLKPGNNRQ